MLFATPVIAVYSLCVMALLGLVMGSFLNCLAWRLCHNESIMHGRSHCTTCGHVMGARDLVPVFSWLASRGRCRYCGAKVSARYPLAELVCAVLYVSILVRFDFSLETIEMLAFASVLFVLALTDIDSFIIPNGCIGAAVVIRVLYAAGLAAFGLVPAGFDWSATVLYYVASAVGVLVALLVLAAIMDKVLGRESIGGGDIKLLEVAALYFGWQQMLLLIIVACIIGIVVGLVQQHKAASGAAAVRTEPQAADDSAAEGSDAAAPAAVDGELAPGAFPWGPSIALACWFCMLWGDAIIQSYLALFL